MSLGFSYGDELSFINNKKKYKEDFDAIKHKIESDNYNFLRLRKKTKDDYKNKYLNDIKLKWFKGEITSEEAKKIWYNLYPVARF